MEEGKEIESDRQRAEVFDALGHPTRIAILKVLQEGAVGFAELKKKTAIEVAATLNHLNKLDGLIKTDEYGILPVLTKVKDALVLCRLEKLLLQQSNSWKKLPSQSCL
jgi:DNA-binding transcriptional ArsR family regulator